MCMEACVFLNLYVDPLLTFLLNCSAWSTGQSPLFLNKNINRTDCGFGFLTDLIKESKC